METALEVFSLRGEEPAILFSMQAFFTQQNIDDGDFSPGTEEFDRQFWLDEWQKLVSGEGTSGLGKTTYNILESRKEIEAALKKIDKTKRLLLLFEASIFTPYFNLGLNSAESRKKNLSSKNDIFDADAIEKWKRKVFKLAKDTKADVAILEKAHSAYSEAIEEISGNPKFLKWAIIAVSVLGVALTAGTFAPAVGALIGGAMGLSGAAATSAGLAFLGGGALAAGGFGVAGGTAVLVGGGALFGGVASSLLTIDFFAQYQAVLSQLARLDAALHTILRTEDSIYEFIETAKRGHIETRKRIRIEIDKYISRYKNKEMPAQHKTAFNNLKRCSEYYERAINRLDALAKEVT